MIDRSSPVPYYEQLYELLLEKIRSSEIGIGERIPGESELHRDYNLSRATARQALELLESNGFAKRVARRGFFASSPPSEEGWLIEGGHGFLDSKIGHGAERVKTDVLRAEVSPLPDHATKALRLPAHTEGFILERIRYLGSELVLLSTNFTPPPVMRWVAEADGVLSGESSLTEALATGGYSPSGARRVIHALPAPHTVAALLKIAEGTPLLRIRSTTWDQSQVPYDYYETWLRSDYVPLELNTSAMRG